jgi:hypothetical protein
MGIYHLSPLFWSELIPLAMLCTLLIIEADDELASTVLEGATPPPLVCCCCCKVALLAILCLAASETSVAASATVVAACFSSALACSTPPLNPAAIPPVRVCTGTCNNIHGQQTRKNILLVVAAGTELVKFSKMSQRY